MIDAKIAALQQVRNSIVAAMSIGALAAEGDFVQSISLNGSSGTASPTQQRGSGPIELPTGVFRDKGLADAIRLYLSIAKRKQTIKEIKTALMDGGLATTSEFFDQTLSGTMHRMKRTGELLQFKDGWDLAESYPDGFRARMTETDEPKRKKKPTPKKKAKASKGAAKAAADTEPS